MANQNDIKENSGTQLNIYDLYRIFIRNWKRISIFPVSIAIIAAIIVFFILDPIFLSTSTVKTASKSGGLSSLVGNSIPDLGDFGDLTGAGGGSISKDLALYENILLSRRCIEETIIKFKLNDEWEFKYMEDAIKNFRESVISIKKDKLAGTMEVGVYDKFPARAKEINEFLIAELNKINTELNVLDAKNNRQFLEDRYNLIKKQLSQCEDSLKKFQDRYGVSPDLVIKAVSQAELQLETEIKSQEIKIELLKKIVSPDQSEIITEEQKLVALKRQLDEIKNSTDVTTNFKLKGAPEIVLNFIRLQRDVEIQNKILTFVIPLLEQAKVEEKKQTPSVLLLDLPNIPERKSKPKRLTIVAITLVLGFLLSTSFFIAKNKWKKFKLNSTAEV
ncbi:MAG: hypothetical protein JSS63_04270 [Bacteroidetes bacterium]|nr:hypothetical protein [Bacteroidota bacterium]